ncbi:MAG: dockerin type I repeat-containing protein, partial [Clostridia bacterium]|nr:dockerin type I repeat-containing protein [Clostridia bacterium]
PHTNSTVVIPPTATEPGYIENVCSVCGNIEVIETIPAEGDGSPSITVSDGAAFSGQTVPLSVTLNNSYGIGSASFYFIYDSDRAELLEVKTSDGNIVNLSKMDDSVYFELKGCKVNEASITCVFKTHEGSVGDVSVSVSYGLASILKSDESVVYPAVDPGVITIADPALKGDANRDNSVDAKDVLLMRKYIAGLEDAESLDMFFADTNSDGSVDMKDVLYARRSIAGLIIS